MAPVPALIGGALLVFGGVAYGAARWGRRDVSRKKKSRKETPAAVTPSRDAAQDALRFERRIQMLENALQVAQDAQKEKDGEVQRLGTAIGSLERELAQETLWRQKEELSALKEKKQEDALRAELDRLNAALHTEAAQRIRYDHERQDLRRERDVFLSDVRKLTGQNNDLERRLRELAEETGALRAENLRLKVKKESDRWVAKDDFDKARTMLENARQEIDRLKALLPA